MTIAPEAPASLSKEERADSAAQSLHSAELEGHSVTPATQLDTEMYVSGEIDSQELLRRVRARYNVG
ncbi:hypothetical protein [Frigoribacterium sp. UYMn621]|uniref:antitoxin VbhA family protein n=1 Tax=Frigoribacterium sp. UYMn621 TaxID=3156343 RepID=UPI00339571E1